MRHVWSVICRYALEDKKSKNFSLIEALEQVSFGGDLPNERPLNLPLTYHIASLWRRDTGIDDSMHNVRIRLLSPLDDELMLVEFNIDFAETESHRTNIDINHFPYSTDGLYEFEVSYRDNNEWLLASSVPLKVTYEGTKESEQDSA